MVALWLERREWVAFGVPVRSTFDMCDKMWTDEPSRPVRVTQTWNARSSLVFSNCSEVTLSVVSTVIEPPGHKLENKPLAPNDRG
jgi:hypothetical protein